MAKIKKNSLKAWTLAARPKTLTGALLPIMIASALAFTDQAFRASPAITCAIFAGLMQIAANFINDLFDFLKGSDRNDRLGPERACAQGWISPNAMKVGIAIVLTTASLIGCTLLLYGGWELVIIGILCILFAFLYTTGPYPLSYKGWGDLLVILFFGFIPVCGTYYVQTTTLTINTLIASLICGLVVDTLLVVNNYRDREADRKSGKLTIVVRFGEPFGQRLYLFLGLSAALLCLLFLRSGLLYAALLPQLYLIPHINTWKKMKKIHKGKALNSILGETSRNILLIGFLLSLGILLN